MRVLSTFALSVILLFTGTNAFAQALFLCAKANKADPTQVRANSPIKLRTACKTKRDGTPKEVSIGTTDQFDAIPVNTADIATNAAAIADNTNNIATSVGAIADNSFDINSNRSLALSALSLMPQLAFSEILIDTALGSDVVLVSVSMSPGNVAGDFLVTGTTNIYQPAGDEFDEALVACSLSRTGLPGEAVLVGETGGQRKWTPVSLQRVFAHNPGATASFDLVCNNSRQTDEGPTRYRNPIITAMFIARRN